MGKKKRKNEEARRRRDRDRMRLRAKRIREEKAIMSVKNKLLEMTFEIDTDSFYSNGNGTDVRRFGEENSVAPP